MEEKNNQSYISLSQAAKMCSYSEPYLRLRARTGKLKSIKLGKKWMTTSVWLDEYADRVKKWNESLEQKKDKPVALLAADGKSADRSQPAAVFVETKKNIPVNPVTTGKPAAQNFQTTANLADQKPNPYFFKWGSLVKPNGLGGKGTFSAVRKKTYQAAGQIIPLPQARAINATSAEKWAGMGAVLSGVVCALALFLAASSGVPAPAQESKFIQANIMQAVDPENPDNIILDSDGYQIYPADGGLSLENGKESALTTFVDWIDQSINNFFAR